MLKIDYPILKNNDYNHENILKRETILQKSFAYKTVLNNLKKKLKNRQIILNTKLSSLHGQVRIFW